MVRARGEDTARPARNRRPGGGGWQECRRAGFAFGSGGRRRMGEMVGAWRVTVTVVVSGCRLTDADRLRDLGRIELGREDIHPVPPPSERCPGPEDHDAFEFYLGFLISSSPNQA